MMSLRQNNLPLLLTSGDPNGIGPEIIVKLFSEERLTIRQNLVAVGPKKVFDFYSRLLKLPEIPKDRVIPVPIPRRFDISPGKISSVAGRLAGMAVLEAAALCLKGLAKGVVTLPLSKEALNLGGFDYPGHTEFLSEITDSRNTAMILHSKKLTVALITAHIPLSRVSKSISAKRIIGKVITVNNSLVTDFGIRNPRTGMLALNPHAGDGGLLGREENEILIPVISDLVSAGFHLRGPYSADGYFAGGTYGKFHLTYGMYHDQGLIPFKMLSFGKGVNYTAGLKIVRTSPDHGTAFDIAGLGKANVSSTLCAIELASEIAERKTSRN